MLKNALNASNNGGKNLNLKIKIYELNLDKLKFVNDHIIISIKEIKRDKLSDT